METVEKLRRENFILTDVSRMQTERIRELKAHLAAAKKVIDAARYIRHWGDAYRDGSGMVVSSEHVRELWRTLETYDRTTKEN